VKSVTAIRLTAAVSSPCR